MNEDEMKNRISLALKDPILQQGFEIICKNLAELEKENAELRDKLNKIERKCRFNFVDLLHDVENESKQEAQLTKPKFVETALKEFFKYWEQYEKQGCKDSMTLAMESTEAFVGLPIVAKPCEVEK